MRESFILGADAIEAELADDFVVDDFDGDHQVTVPELPPQEATRAPAEEPAPAEPATARPVAEYLSGLDGLPPPQPPVTPVADGLLDDAPLTDPQAPHFPVGRSHLDTSSCCALKVPRCVRHHAALGCTWKGTVMVRIVTSGTPGYSADPNTGSTSTTVATRRRSGDRGAIG